MTVTTDDLQWFGKQFGAIVDNIEPVIQGKRRTIELATICLLSEGHALIEDVPGVGKTLLARSLARSIDCSFQRIQFTPDLMPSDITGTELNRVLPRISINSGNEMRSSSKLTPAAWNAMRTGSARPPSMSKYVSL